ncbi:hypothetical protein JDV02_010693 [Purpureocillium takamizusanense]|uniref:Zn(2)-C6 fungal-type domain-containing protein n=1 Tax=Purpureocillium takamizusanense TaxID=2060973 RepID=A0A9Q8VFF2_9HYPO|nr:uncharacterized protein JDV02_010693 [Purpureocillium takamizusanense]UNI24980.1 hypothetical protein JDV02_010693 [Purpureocillium takamizusanense]
MTPDSESPPNNLPHHQPKMHPRLKVVKACESCRRRKIKCDARQPSCRPCLERDGPACRYSTESTRRVGRPPKSTRAAHHPQPSSSVSSSMTYTKDDSKTSSPASGTPASATRRAKDEDAISIDADAMTGMVGDPAKSVEFFGRSSAGSFLRQINSAIDAQLGQGQMVASTDLDGVSPMRANNHGARRMKDPRDFVLPQRLVADDLLQCYYDYVWSILPVHDWVAFKATYHLLWTGSLPAVPEATLYCMVNMAFALGSQFSVSIEPDQRREVGQSFWERARKLFGPHTHDSASLERVQCMLLMGLYLQSTSDTHECWMTIGSAIRMAQSLGLHLSNAIKKVPGSREVEIARRVWHGCVYMDRVLSMTFGRPSMIASWLPETVQVPVPSMIDDEYLDSRAESSAIRPDGEPSVVAFFVKTIELYDIINDIILELYQSSTDMASKETHHLVAVLQFDDRLLKWEQSLPEHLQYAHCKGEQDLIFERQRIVLRARYLQARIVVLRPILADYYLKLINLKNVQAARDTGLSQHLIVKSAELCFEAAHEMIDVLYDRFDLTTVTGPVPAWWFAVLFVYTAATVLLAERLRPIDHRPEASGAWRGDRSWHRAIELLKAYSRVGQSAERCVAALGILSSKIPSASLYNHGNGDNLQSLVDVQVGGRSGSSSVENAFGQQNATDNELNFQFDFSNLDFDIDDMFWLNTSAAGIIF